MGNVRVTKVTITATCLVAAAIVVSVIFITRSGKEPSDDASHKRNTAVRKVDLTARISAYADHFAPDGPYRRPTRAERAAVAAGVGDVLDGRTVSAADRLATVGYRVEVLRDSASGRRYAEIADEDRHGSERRGWGRVWVDLDGGATRWSVQVPHPTSDRHTERIGAGVLTATPGGVLVVAGANRAAGADGSSDVAHRRDTVFDAVCTMLVGRGLPGLQVHGFADASLPGYDVVVSTGKGSAGRPRGRGVADRLAADGFRVCRAWVRACGSLEGRTNAQGDYAAAKGVPFLHIEHAYTLRASPRARAAAIAAESAGLER